MKFDMLLGLFYFNEKNTMNDLPNQV